ncbi:MAG: 3-phosphoshikimate 1-carboxyvinyltransferase, partial [Syntrophobacteraceae bacterium]|nr:3-phosphoshikimate 1-carboxyvinyltransferase [Syntrophobacteraceae bacterium]
MPNLIIHPSGPLRGQTGVPGDKSISNRFLIVAALAEGESVARGWLASDDTLATLRCLAGLGVEVERPGEDDVVVWGQGLHSLTEPTEVLYALARGW